MSYSGLLKKKILLLFYSVGYVLSIAFLVFSASNYEPWKAFASYCSAFVLMLLSPRVLNGFSKKELYLFVFCIAVISRVLMLQYPNGDDMNRYLWEGRIQNHGFNPFTTAPDSERTKYLRDENWSGINHKNIPTIYWPLAQLIFRLSYTISPTYLFFKIVMLIFDLGIILSLLVLLNVYKINPVNIVYYALNPFVLTWFSGEGHIDSVMVFFVVLSLLFYKKEWYGFSYLSIGFAIMVKLTPIFFIPFLVKKDNLKTLPTVILPFLLFIPYLTDNFSPLGVPIKFASEFYYNGLVFTIFKMFLDSKYALFGSFVIVAVVYLVIFFISVDIRRQFFLSSALFVLATPVFHPWYLLIVTPFLVFYRSPPFLILHLTVFFKAFFFIDYVPGYFWHDNALGMTLEYMPFVAVLFVSILRSGTVFPFRYASAKDVSVIIPTLNEADNIEGCLESVFSQEFVKEVIVSDCGSSDSTCGIAESYTLCRVINSDKGRGVQIASALKECCGDVVCIVHADCRLKNGVFSKMISKLNKKRDASGGAFLGSYNNGHPFLSTVNLLNILKVELVGISFGDQGQFFRREIMKDNFPEFKLMEDVELSYILKEKGAIISIPGGIVRSNRRWERVGFLKNITDVFYLMGRFLLMRKFGLLSSDCSNFYRYYYGKK